MRIQVPISHEFLFIDNKMKTLIVGNDAPILKSLILAGTDGYELTGTTVKWNTERVSQLAVVHLTVGNLTITLPYGTKVLCMKEVGIYFWSPTNAISVGDSIFTYSRSLFVTQLVSQVETSTYSGDVFVVESERPIFIGVSSPRVPTYHTAILVAQ